MYKVAHLFSILKPYKTRSRFLPWIILGLDLLGYILIFFGILSAQIALFKLIGSVLLGVMIALLFIVGHDCCHGSFTKNHRANELFGVLAFLPSYHNFSLWHLGHNLLHHRFTNFRGRDYVYVPVSPEEYNEMTLLQRMQYRLYRTPLGHLFYYLVQIWFKKMIVPHNKIEEIDLINRNRAIVHSISVLVFLSIQIISILLFSEGDMLTNFMCTLLIPFLVWNWIMGFAIYQHHTHPAVKWYASFEDWDYWKAQIEGSVQIRFPRWVEFMLHNIMDHTAHHANPAIPLYNLKNAQNKLRSAYPNEVISVHWSIRTYLNNLKECYLYDYERQKWVSYRSAKQNRKTTTKTS